MGGSPFFCLATWAQGRLELVLFNENLEFLSKKLLRLGLNQKCPLVKVSNDELLTASKSQGKRDRQLIMAPKQTYVRSLREVT